MEISDKLLRLPFPGLMASERNNDDYKVQRLDGLDESLDRLPVALHCCAGMGFVAQDMLSAISCTGRFVFRAAWRHSLAARAGRSAPVSAMYKHELTQAELREINHDYIR